MKPLYAVIDPEGNVVDVVSDVNQAISIGSQFADEVVLEPGPTPDEMAAAQGGAFGGFGAVPPQKRYEAALRASGLASRSPIPVDMNMSLEEAWERLYPYFPQQRFFKTKKGRAVNAYLPIDSYSTPEKMVNKLLGKNYKTAKKDLGHENNTSVVGLSLLPATQMANAHPDFRKLDACVGASTACRKTCLVYSGHNEIDPYNKQIKRARHEALLREPRAFVRMLAASIEKHLRSRAVPFVRLNVFSDLPWERICPDLFTEFSDLGYYDYTKVPRRRPRDLGIENYDLTFSFSGTNHAEVAEEIDFGRRIAVVFLPKERVPAKSRKRGEGLPVTFDVNGFFGSQYGRLPVIDGDVSDVRPYDTKYGRCIVGLRWKDPRGKKAEGDAATEGGTKAAQMLKLALDRAFVLPVQLHDGVLVAGVSARQESIIDADDEEEE